MRPRFVLAAPLKQTANVEKQYVHMHLRAHMSVLLANDSQPPYPEWTPNLDDPVHELKALGTTEDGQRVLSALLRLGGQRLVWQWLVHLDVTLMM